MKDNFNPVYGKVLLCIIMGGLVLTYLSCSNLNNMDKKYIEVREWLQAVPTSDNPFWVGSNIKAQYSWEKWLEKGWKIKDLESTLLRLLEELDIDKVTILVAIGIFGSHKSYDILLKFAKKENPVLRTEAVAALGSLQLEDAILFLCSIRNDLDENVRANVYMALSQFDSSKADICLRHGLKDESEFVRKITNKALEK